MNLSTSARAVTLVVAALSGGYAPNLNAQEANVLPSEAAWELMLSPYAYHFHRDEAHQDVWLVGLERQHADGWLWGAAYLDNSFGQRSGSVYFGYIWNRPLGMPAFYVKLTAGILYGYVEPYEDKVPFNHNGWSPTIVPALGYRLTSKDAVQVALLGNAGLLFSYNRRF